MLNISCRVRHCLAGQSALASLTPLGKHVPINYFLEGIAFSALTLPSVHTVDWTLGTASGLKKK